MTLVPAYGRDYASQSAVQADFDAGNDFLISDMSSPDDGRYANRDDLIASKVSIRYQRKTKLAILQVK